jgi:hypothetical protein
MMAILEKTDVCVCASRGTVQYLFREMVVKMTEIESISLELFLRKLQFFVEGAMTAFTGHKHIMVTLINIEYQ